MDNRMIDKLRKVLALTASPNEHEASAAAAHLQRLLTQYNLDIADLEQRGASTKVAATERPHDLGKAAFKWKLDLAEGIAEHYYCFPLVNRITKKVAFVGRPDNVESLQMLYGWIIDQIKRIATAERRRHFDETQEHIDPLRWQVSFGVGCVERLLERLTELKARQAEDEADSEAGAKVTAMVVSHQNEISDYLESVGRRRIDGRETTWEREYRLKREEEDVRLEKLKETDLEAYYHERPWERPETPEQQAAREEADAEYWRKEAKREAARARRRDNYIPRGSGRSSKPTDWSKLEQSSTAESAGRKSADKVNLQPFLGAGTADKRRIK